MAACLASLLFATLFTTVALATQPPEISKAAGDGDANTVATLLDKNPSLIEKQDGEGNTPLFYAVAAGRDQVVKLLLSKGAKVTAKDTKGTTPLHIAAVYDRGQIAEILIDAGADVNALTEERITPLHWAALYGSTAVAKVLLKKGAALNPKDKTGNTPLHNAAHMRIQLTQNEKGGVQAHSVTHEVAIFLVEKGADAHIANDHGKTPLDIATQELDTDLADAMRKREATGNAQKK